jgi:hypothetical protein
VGAQGWYVFDFPSFFSFPQILKLLVLSKAIITAIDDFDLYSCVSNDDG